MQEAAAALEDEADDTDVVSGQEQEALALVAGAFAGGDPTQERESPLRPRGATANTDAAAPLLDQMRALADERYRRADARATRLMDWIGETCFPDGDWNNERVIVFTEYRATLDYLDELLTAPRSGWPSMTGRVEVFHGSLDAEERERDHQGVQLQSAEDQGACAARH